MAGELRLLDYRRRVAALYRLARDPSLPPARRWERFRRQREALFREHPCSPLSPDARRSAAPLPYFPYDPGARVLAAGEPCHGAPFEVRLREDGTLRLAPLARLRFELHGRPSSLVLYRLLGYGGGLFLPFRDATAGRETYGGGRYLIDTLKHADLGSEDGLIVLDFNFAYHPSCAYSPRWDCPLAPSENRLDVRIEAGERLPEAGWRPERR